MSNRPLTDDEKADRAKHLRALAENVTNQVIEGLRDAMRTCITCEFWQERDELCNNKINCPQSPARPPARIIALGCDHYKPGVPF